MRALLLLFAASATSALHHLDRQSLAALLPYLTLTLAVALALRVSPSAADASLAAATVALIIAVSVLFDAESAERARLMRAPGGLLGNRNVAGQLLALATALSFPCFAQRRQWRPLLVIIAAALTLTRCRTAWLALVAAAIAALLLSPSKRRSAANGAWLAAGVIFAALMPTRLHWRDAHPLAATGARLLSLRDGSGALRVAQHRLVFHNLGDWLRGWAPGSWHRVAGAVAPELARNYVPSSDYLRVLCDGGLPALLGLMLFYVALWRWLESSRRPFVLALALTSLGDVPLLRIECMGLVALACVAAPRSRSASS